MSADLTLVQPAQQWTARRFAYFNGMFDTHAATGEDYSTQALAKVWTMKPGDKPKGAGLAMIPSAYADFDGREHAAQRERGRYIALTADFDSGNHDTATVRSAVEAFAGASAWLIYSSPHSRPGDQRWRVILPLEAEQPFETWHDAQLAFYAFLDARGIECDYALARAAQPVYLPNVPAVHAKSETPLRGPDGKPLYFTREASPITCPGLSIDQGPVSQGITALRRARIEDEAARNRIKQEAEQRRANAPRGDNASIMDDFNAANSVAMMLEICGYEQCPRNADDWRSPHQTGETYATRVMSSKWVSLSASDTAAGIGSKCAAGCYGDAYDLYVHFTHGGNHKDAYRAIGAEKRAASGAIYPPAFHADPPEWMQEAPMPNEMLDDWEATGEPDFGEYEDPGEGGAFAVPTLPFFWFKDAEPNLDANDFVEGLLTTSAMSVVYGPSNCGKTFFIVDLALHVAWGRDWRGRQIDRGAIVYLSLEGAQGIRNRMAAFRKHHELDGIDLPFIAMPRPVNLLNEDADVNAVIALTHHVAAETGLPVAMVIIDTLSRAMAGGNENSPEDMTALIGNCDRIRDATQAHVCIVHHSGKDEARGARGHSSLRAATDTEIEIKRDPELTFSSVRIAKQRDLEAGDPFAFTLQGVALGINRRGKEVTSCVVIETDAAPILARDPDKLSPKETAALDSLERCLVAGGFDASDGTGDMVTAVTLHSWRGSMQALKIISTDDNVARPQLYRLKKALEVKGQIGGKGDKIWML